MRPATLKTQRSAGGVIYRRRGGAVEIAMIAIKGGSVWCLPKGMVDRGETPEEAAVREVREETGLKGTIVDKVGSVSYWYFIKEENAKCKKTVDFYLMRYVGGSTSDHDREVDESSWLPIEEASERAAYKGDREIISRAGRIIARGQNSP
ncbi:MAG: NUDIX hydrolase [Thermodesulfovibrionales bacterium]